MLYWPLMFLFIALTAGLLAIAFTAAGARKFLPAPYPHTRWDSATYIPAWLGRLRTRALAATCKIHRTRLGKVNWRRGVRYFAICTTLITAGLFSVGFHHVYFNRTNLPDIGPFARFEFSTIGHVYDANGQPLFELAKEYRKLAKYHDIPPIVRHAIIAAEDKRFFSHSGVDYSVIPRVLGKVRMRVLAAHLLGLGRQDEALFPQGGSTITQQLVRGYFLKELTDRESSKEFRHGGFLPRALSYAIGARSVNMLVRKLEEIRLSLWIEEEMQNRFGLKRHAKQEILARYASFIYMGNSQYGFATAAEYYFGRSLATFTADDADKAALLAGIAKSPRDYAPSAKETKRVLRRRNQTLALMAANGFISRDTMEAAKQRPLQVAASEKDKMPQVSAVLGNVLLEITGRGAHVSVEGLLRGQIQVYTTVDARVQQIANQALERGLELYEQRHPSAKGIIQGSVVVLKNRDASILARRAVVSSTKTALHHTATLTA